jgi:hypothetical protein
VIGEEFAHHVSPLAGVRVFSPFDDFACDVCGAENATCTSHTPPQPEPFDVRSAVEARAQQQTKRPVGRPPKDPVKRAAKEAATVVESAASDVPLEAGTSYVPQPGPVLDAGGHEAPPPVPKVPAGDPTEVRDCYVTPEGLVDPADDPHRPDPARTVLVSEASQLLDTGAWMTLPDGQKVATTRDVLRVFWGMGCKSPSYAMVAPVGSVRPKAVS